MRNKITTWLQCSLVIGGSLFAERSFAAPADGEALDLTMTVFGFVSLAVLLIAYVLVAAEDHLRLRKSKPVMVAAGIIWLMVGIGYREHGGTEYAAMILRHDILEYAELLLFLLAAMTYINTMMERNVFDALRGKLIAYGFSLRAIFWLTGLLAFLISPVADNLTTAMIMCAVVKAVGAGNRPFIALACINIVVAANAGGAFSPFGDITTLMVWQQGMVRFGQFFHLLIPAAVNWLVPALLMSFAVGGERPTAIVEQVEVKQGGFVVIVLFLGTIGMAVSFYNLFLFPPVLGMMTGLGILKLYGYTLRRRELNQFFADFNGPEALDEIIPPVPPGYKLKERPFDIFISMKRSEWDTLMFFYGVILSVGGLGVLGYLTVVSQHLYLDLGPTWANIVVGILSAIIDNIPVMFAVLTMEPEMDLSQWLLVTLTAGVGGSLLSIGSAAGVALMGQARGIYTFFYHLKWSWAIALGYAASVWVHLLIN